MTEVNPDILRWARETAGLSLEEACLKLGIKTVRGLSPKDRLIELETGKIKPTRAMLLKMSKKYRRPLIVFYMDKPPIKGNRGQDFRHLPDIYPDETNALVDALIRDIQVRQSILRTALEDEDEIINLDYVDSMIIEDGMKKVIDSINKTIGLDLRIFRNQPTPESAFKYLRMQVENVGIFVLLIGDLGSHHTTIKLDVFRGFALSDKIAPFIVINDHDAKSAWSFTLLHELVHIWLGETGISSTDSDLGIEQFCNKVASELLLPKEELNLLNLNFIDNYEDRKNAISEFAAARNLSSSMVAYKLFLQKIINKETWIQLKTDYQQLWWNFQKERKENEKQKGSGPTYYVVRRHRLGNNLISLVQQMVLGGTLTTTKAGKVLGIAPKNIQNLIDSHFNMKSV